MSSGTDRGEVRLRPHRSTRGVGTVSIGSDKPEAMRVRQVVVDPVALLGRHAIEVEFAGCDDDVGLRSVNGVAIDVQRILESVVTLDLLKLVERRRQQPGVHESHVVDRPLGRRDLPRVRLNLSGIVLRLNIRQARTRPSWPGCSG